MAAKYGTICCVAEVQKKHPEEPKEFANVRSITVEISEPAFQKGSWLVK